MAKSKFGHLLGQQIILAPRDKGPFRCMVTLVETSHYINPKTEFLKFHSFTNFLNDLCPSRIPQYYYLLNIYLYSYIFT